MKAFIHALRLHNVDLPKRRIVKAFLAVFDGKWPDHKKPSEKTVLREIGRVPVAAVAQATGPKALDKHLPHVQRDWSSLPPNACWFVDTRKMDTMLQDDRGKPWRPSVVFVMDAATREWLGFDICAGAVNADSICRALRMAMEKFGLPEELCRDNGKDYRSRQLDAVLAMLDVAVTNDTPYNARAKAIESAFNVFGHEFEPALPGYTGRDAKRKPEGLQRQIDRGELLTFHEYGERLVEFLTYCNLERPHGGIDGKTPAQVREEWRAKGWLPRQPDAETFAQITLHRTDPLTVRGDGVRVAGQRYYSPELVMHSGEKLVAVYRPEDMAGITVVTPSGRFVCEAQATVRAIHGQGMEALKQTQRYKKAAKQRVAQHIGDVMALTDEQELADAVAATTKPRPGPQNMPVKRD